MAQLSSFLRPALRSLARSPGFAAAVIATFALGVGVNTAIFSAAWSLLLAPLPLRDPDRLVALYETHEADLRRPLAPANFLDWRRESKTLAGIGLYGMLSLAVGASAGDLRALVLRRGAAQALLGAALVLLAAVALLASWLPARRAARVDPVTVLRDE